MNKPPRTYQLEAVGLGDGGRSATDPTTVNVIPSGRTYIGGLVVRNPNNSGRTYDIYAFSSGGSTELATLSQGEQTVVDESDLSDCVGYDVRAYDQSDVLRSEVSFVFRSDLGSDLWNLPAGAP